MSQWYFFYYIPAKTCSGVLRQRAEPSVLSKGKAQKTLLNPLYCIDLWFAPIFSWVLWCDTHQLRGRVGTAGPLLDFSSEVWGTQVTRGVKTSGEIFLCWDSPQHLRVGIVLLLECSFERPAHPNLHLLAPLKVLFAHAAHQGAWSCSQPMEEKWGFLPVFFLPPFVMGKNKGPETSVNSVPGQGRSWRGVRKAC